MKFEIHFFDNRVPEIIDAPDIKTAMENPPTGAKLVQIVGYKPPKKYVDIIPAEIYFQGARQMLAAYAGKYILCDKAGDMLAVASTKKEANKKKTRIRNAK